MYFFVLLMFQHTFCNPYNSNNKNKRNMRNKIMLKNVSCACKNSSNHPCCHRFSTESKFLYLLLCIYNIIHDLLTYTFHYFFDSNPTIFCKKRKNETGNNKQTGKEKFVFIIQFINQLKMR